MRIGQVIVTYGAPALVDLQLAASPKLPSFVWDDGSGDGRLPEVCRRHGAAFDAAPAPVGHHPGAMLGAERGIAAMSSMDWVFVRMRRFVPLYDWRDDLLAAAARSPLPCLGTRDRTMTFEVRFDAWAVRPAAWRASGAAGVLLRDLYGPHHDYPNSHACLYWAMQRASGRGDGRGVVLDNPPFGSLMPIVSADRHRPGERPVLWRHHSRTADYATAGAALGLGWAASDYEPQSNYPPLGHDLR